MKLVAILLPDDAPTDWIDALPQNIFITTHQVADDELTDDRAMAINGQSIGLAFARAQRKASEREQNER